MMHDHRPSGGAEPSSPWYRSRAGLAFAGFAAVAALLLIYEHRMHISFGNLLVILPLFVCFGLHSFMHGGHGGHGGHNHSGTTPKSLDPSKSSREEDRS
jgi:hypothetical protein